MKIEGSLQSIQDIIAWCSKFLGLITCVDWPPCFWHILCLMCETDCTRGSRESSQNYPGFLKRPTARHFVQWTPRQPYTLQADVRKEHLSHLQIDVTTESALNPWFAAYRARRIRCNLTNLQTLRSCFIWTTAGKPEQKTRGGALIYLGQEEGHDGQARMKTWEQGQTAVDSPAVRDYRWRVQRVLQINHEWLGEASRGQALPHRRQC
jgi:hypothetical protein